MRSILVTNAKGGCGKSTLATNLAAYYASEGYETALADYDPQQSALAWLEQRPEDPAALAGLAEAMLLRGDAIAAREAAARASRALPGDLQLRALAVRTALHLGEHGEARALAVSLLTDARSRGDLRAARELLARIDSTSAQR